MFMRLFGLMSGRAWLIALGLAAVGGGWLWYEAKTARLETALAETRGEVATLTAARDQWQARAEQRQRDLDAAEARARAQQAALTELQASLAEIDARYRALHERIAQAPVAADGPVAPVLRDTLEALP